MHKKREKKDFIFGIITTAVWKHRGNMAIGCDNQWF